jgi:preprotein translocase subunit SecD
VITAAFERSFANWNCANDPDPTEGSDKPNDYIIACQPNPAMKYLLAPTAIEGTEIDLANAGLNAYENDEWVVNLGFDKAGAAAWYSVTKLAYETNAGQPSKPGSCNPPTGCNSVAIVLDGVVQSAPTILDDGIPGRLAQISGGFNQQSAKALADILKYGSLPAPLHRLTTGAG